jgi:RNA-directed DNA polymerase
MSLTTPSKIRELQIKLYRKAKSEPEYRFYMLYDKIYREDILLHAYERARANKGAPGVDGQTFEQIESAGLEKWLTGIREEVRSKTYKPQPVRRVMIPKPGGGERPLGIPTIRDRVIQTAVKLLIEPIFEADFEPNAYGYRPKRSAQDAIQEVHELLCEGYTDVVDADLSKYFDTIPHSGLMQCVARRIVDKHLLHLLKMWLKVPAEERDEKGNKRLTGGRDNDRGTPQGGVMSPRTQKITCPGRRPNHTGIRRRHSCRSGAGRPDRQRVANGDGIVTDQNLLDQQAQDLLALPYIECLGSRAQLAAKRRQRLGQLQISRIVDSGYF